MRILLADKFPTSDLEALSGDGHECDLKPDLNGDTLPGAIGNAEILVVRSTPVTRATVDAGPSLCLIIRAGAGTNSIDMQAATEREIRVCNVPGRNAAAVAELVIGLIIAIDRNIPDNVADLRAGRWNKKRYSAARGLYGRSLGLVGLGAVGLAVLERARGFGFEMRVIDKLGRAAEVQQRLREMGVRTVPNLDDLIDQSDILSFHLPAVPETRGMVNSKFLEKLHPGTILINTSRGDLVDEQALIRVLDEKALRVGLDVYRDEPGSSDGKFSSVLACHPSVYGTHHIGASTAQAQSAVAKGVLEIIVAFGDGRILNCVNMPS